MSNTLNLLHLDQMLNSKPFALACVILIGSLTAACSQSGSKSPANTGISSSVYLSARKVLDYNGFTDFQPTGEAHVSGSPSVAEIVYTNGDKTVEIDVEKSSGNILKIEEETTLDAIPADIVQKAKESGVDLESCGIYQAAKNSSGKLVGYEFDDCEFSKKDVEVNVKTLDIDVEMYDDTTRDS